MANSAPGLALERSRSILHSKLTRLDHTRYLLMCRGKVVCGDQEAAQARSSVALLQCNATKLSGLASRRVAEPAAAEINHCHFSCINALLSSDLAADLRPKLLGEGFGFTPLA